MPNLTKRRVTRIGVRETRRLQILLSVRILVFYQC
jgi:hypothetical protein